MSAGAAVDLAKVRAAAEGVADPEMPAVTIGMLGMIHALEIDGARVTVTLLPTFAGCPATEMIERDVRGAVSAVAGVDEVKVRFVYDPPWTSDRITLDGHDRLREFGIAPPVGAIASGPVPGDARRLPVTAPTIACPYCGSTDTSPESAFGPTPCRAIHHCGGCRQPFEAFKTL